jgi:hypothetical protein
MILELLGSSAMAPAYRAGVTAVTTGSDVPPTPAGTSSGGIAPLSDPPKVM